MKKAAVLVLFLLMLSGCGLRDIDGKAELQGYIREKGKENNSWQEVYYGILTDGYAETPPRWLELIDVDFDEVPELFILFMDNSRGAITEVGYSWKEGEVKTIAFGEFSVSAGFVLYRNTVTGETVWMEDGGCRGLLGGYSYQYRILDFSELSYVKRIHFFSYEECRKLSDDGTLITTYQDADGETVTLEEIERQREAAFADYERIEAIKVTEEVPLEDKGAFLEFCDGYYSCGK